jgi:hypothetical protein
MAGWVTITTGDVQKALSAPEYAAYTAAALALDAAEIIVNVSRLVAGYCPAQHADPAKVPVQLEAVAVKLAVIELLGAVPGALGELADKIERDRAWAMSVLRDVAAGRLLVDPPDSPASTTPSSPSPSFTDTERRFTRDTEDGL